MKQYVKKLLVSALALAMLASFSACGKTNEAQNSSVSAAGSQSTPAESTPQEVSIPSEITFVIPYSDTSGTNTVWRAFGAALEEMYGTTVVYENQSGASGAVGATYYMTQSPHDGTSVVCMAESTTLFKANELADYTYDDFDPLVLLSANCGIMVTYPGSEMDGMNFNELIAYLQDHPSTTVGGTGVGGMGWIWYTILQEVYGIELNVIDFDGSGEGNTQLMGGHIELFVNGYTTGKSLIDAGSVFPICVFNKERLVGLPDIPSVSEYTNELDKYMPNGSFFVAEVSKDVPAEMTEALREAFLNVAQGDKMQTWCAANNGEYLGLTGDEANEYMKHQQAVNSYLLYDSGNSPIDPATYGMTRP